MKYYSRLAAEAVAALICKTSYCNVRFCAVRGFKFIQITLQGNIKF